MIDDQPVIEQDKIVEPWAPHIVNGDVFFQAGVDGYAAGLNHSVGSSANPYVVIGGTRQQQQLEAEWNRGFADGWKDYEADELNDMDDYETCVPGGDD